MRGERQGRFGPGAWLALAVFALVLLVSPAQHEDFSPDAVPGHCHACTASPVALMGPDDARDLRVHLTASGEAVPLAEHAEGLLRGLSTDGRAPPAAL